MTIKYVRLLDENGEEVVMQFRDFAEALRIYMANGAGTLGVKAFTERKVQRESDVKK